ncbi:hypothetical protein K4H02_26120, partial [Mycobacterium tuberculosis]|nr:hypothetical protein [Mycobacterium tuberculosis]
MTLLISESESGADGTPAPIATDAGPGVEAPAGSRASVSDEAASTGSEGFGPGKDAQPEAKRA